MILGHTLALEILSPELVLNRRYPLQGRFFIPFNRLEVILRNPVAIVIHNADRDLGLRVALLGQREEDTYGLAIVPGEIGRPALLKACCLRLDSNKQCQQYP
jgi:hypothetical protein